MSGYVWRERLSRRGYDSAVKVVGWKLSLCSNNINTPVKRLDSMCRIVRSPPRHMYHFRDADTFVESFLNYR